MNIISQSYVVNSCSPFESEKQCGKLLYAVIITSLVVGGESLPVGCGIFVCLFVFFFFLGFQLTAEPWHHQARPPAPLNKGVSTASGYITAKYY